MVPPKIAKPGVELPKPIKAGIPAEPSIVEVRVTGSPEAKGIIAPLPFAPAGPLGPLGPVGPVGPCWQIILVLWVTGTTSYP